MIGIGDPHFDGKLAEHIPNFNDVIGTEIRTVLMQARRKGASLVLLYGDICERSVLSDDARRVLLTLFKEFEDLMFIMWRGNHDTLGPQETEPCSLDPFHVLIDLGYLKNVRVVRHAPKDFFTNSDTPIRVLPWPYADTNADLINFMHVEAAGATWETGRPVEEGYAKNHLCCVGHIHTAQKVRNCHYSGTLYQTTFGEAPEKYYHDILWTGDPKTSKVKLIPHAPKYLLKNAVIRSHEEFTTLKREIQDAPDTTLWKIFINSKKVILPVNAFDNLPTVIKHTPYKTKEELVTKINEELALEDRSSSVYQDTDAALNVWMKRNGIDAELQGRVLARLQNLLAPSMEKT